MPAERGRRARSRARGIHAAGWKGKVDARGREGRQDRRLEVRSAGGAELHSRDRAGRRSTGTRRTPRPATTPCQRDVHRAEAYMSSNDHPHPYGVFIGGNKLDTDQATLLYCAPYGNGNFIVRGFGPAPFRGWRPPRRRERRGEEGRGQGPAVTQEIALRSRADKASCQINGAESWRASEGRTRRRRQARVARRHRRHPRRAQRRREGHQLQGHQVVE